MHLLYDFSTNLPVTKSLPPPRVSATTARHVTTSRCIVITCSKDVSNHGSNQIELQVNVSDSMHIICKILLNPSTTKLLLASNTQTLDCTGLYDFQYLHQRDLTGANAVAVNCSIRVPCTEHSSSSCSLQQGKPLAPKTTAIIPMLICSPHPLWSDFHVATVRYLPTSEW